MKKVIHQIDKKWKTAPFSNLYSKIWVPFCLNTKKHFLSEIALYIQQKKHRFFKSRVSGIFKLALPLRDRHGFMRQSLKILNVFNTLTLKQIFWKRKTFFIKNWVPLFSWKYYEWERNISIQNCSIIIQY